MKMPDLAARFNGLGFEPNTMSPDEFRQFIRTESATTALARAWSARGSFGWWC